MSIEFTYLYQPPKKYTFEQPKLKQWVESYCTGKTLNLFSGLTKLDADETRVDINPSMVADYYMDAIVFLDTWDGHEFDTVILDPPYNWRKAKEKYENKMIGQYPILKDKLTRITHPGSVVISLGYDSVGMSQTRGFEKFAICLVCHSGDFRDTICVIERMKYKIERLYNNGNE